MIRVLTAVRDVQRPEVTGTVQRITECDGKEFALVRYARGRFALLPLSRLRAVTRPLQHKRKPVPRNKHRVRGTYAAFKILHDLKGWTPAECVEKSLNVGLSVVEVLEALLDNDDEPKKGPKPSNLDVPNYLPSEQEIREACLEIRSRWSAAERRSRYLGTSHRLAVDTRYVAEIERDACYEDEESETDDMVTV